MKLTERIELLRRALPKRDGAFMYATERDKAGRWGESTFFVVIASAQGSFSLHPVVFQKGPWDYAEWTMWIETYAPEVISNNVLAAVNRATQDNWKVYRSIGWTRGGRGRAWTKVGKIAERVERRYQE